MGVLSQGKAAELAGLSRAAFLNALSHFGVSPFQETAEDILESIKELRKLTAWSVTLTSNFLFIRVVPEIRGLKNSAAAPGPNGPGYAGSRVIGGLLQLS